MFEFDLGFLGPLIVISAVFARPYILKKIKREGTLINISYFLVVILIGTPFYMLQGKYTLSSMNDTIANELVKEVLKQEYLSDFKDVENVQWLPFSENKNLYSIKADATEKGHLYRIYMQPTCKFFEGCEITMDKILIVRDEDLNIPVNYIDEQTFEKRPCTDKYIESVLLKESIRTAFKTLFDNYNKIDGGIASQSIDYIKVTNIHESNAVNLSDELKKLHLLNSCQATYELQGDFLIKKDDIDYMPIIKILLDKTEQIDKKYKFTSRVDYNVFYNDERQILMSAQPFNMEKFNKAKILQKKD